MSEMQQTNFERTRCVNIGFHAVNLSYSTFSYANAKYSRFSIVDFNQVNFSFANLQSSDLLHTNMVAEQLRSAISFRNARINKTLNMSESNLIQNGDVNCHIPLFKYWTLQLGQINIEISKENKSNCYFALQSYDTGAIMFQNVDISNKWDCNSWPRSEIVLSANMSMNVSIELRQIDDRHQIHSRKYLSKLYMILYNSNYIFCSMSL